LAARLKAFFGIVGVEDGLVLHCGPEVLQGARSGGKFSQVVRRLGLTTQRVASAIGRDPNFTV
jgi:hypothetical protein